MLHDLKKFKFPLNQFMDPCAWPKCKQDAEYKAPYNKNCDLYFYLCLQHIRFYNRSWNFLENFTTQEIECFIRDNATGHRPSWPLKYKQIYAYSLRADVHIFTSPGTCETKHSSEYFHFSVQQQQAIQTLHLRWPYTLAELKRLYKKIVKKYHPDTNPSPQAEDMFKKNVAAYKLLYEEKIFISPNNQ